MLELLKESKSEMEKDGFLILGVFGSYARDENTPSSDVDILYDTEADFFKRYGGFGSFIKLDEIKESLAKKLQIPVDIVYKKGLPQNSIAQIEKEMVYV